MLVFAVGQNLGPRPDLEIQSMHSRLSWICPILLALAACGKGHDLPQQPQMITDADSLDFGQSLGYATYVGTAPQESLQIHNGGLDDLLITSATLNGDPEFTMTGPLSMRVTGQQNTFIRIIFAPSSAKIFNSTLTIVSNAQNAPTKTVTISGKGVNP